MVDSDLNRSLAVLVAGTLFMELLDGQILSTAAPQMAHTLHVAPTSIGVAITAYLVALAALIPLSGWMTNRVGARTLFVTAIAVFTVSSALCATSDSLRQLVGWRVLQGLGGAMMVPVGRLVVLRSTERVDLVRAIALLTWPALIAPVVAPLIGGLLTTYLSWRWVFLVNLPLGAAAAAVAIRVVPQVRDERSRLDIVGLVLTALSLGCVVVAATELGATRVPWASVAVFGGGGIAAGALASWHLLRSGQPLLDLRTLRIKTFRTSMAGGSTFRITVSAIPFLLPLLFQDAFGWTAVKSGAVVLTLFIGNVAIKPVTTGALRRFGFRSVIITAALVVGVTLGLCASLRPHTPLPALTALLVVSGAGRSLGFTAYNTIAFADVPTPLMNHANTLSSTVQMLSVGLGVAVGGLALRVGESVTRSGGGASVDAFRVAFALLAAGTLVAIVEAARLPRDAGAIVSTGRSRKSL